MSQQRPRWRRREPSETWRERFAAAPGWRAARGRPAPLEVGGRSYALTPLGSCAAAVALLCEPEIGGPLPDYAARRAIRGELRRLHPRHLALFVDGACFARVWSWDETRPGGLRAYREEEGGAGPPAAALASLAAAPAPPSAVVDPALLRAVLGRLLRALGRAPAGALTPQAVQDAIEGGAAVPPLRAAWRALLGTRVLDPACRDGSWLLGAAEVLEAPYLACLERMRSWLHELDRERPAPRRDRLGDFRRLVGRAGGTEARRRWVRELIVYHNLWGADPDPGSVRGARTRLRTWLEEAPGPEALPPPEGFACDLRPGDPGRGVASARELERRLDARGHGAAAAAVREDAWLVALARAEIRRLHLDSEVGPGELSRATLSVHRRLTRAGARLDGLLGELAPGAPRPLHPLLEHAGIAGPGAVCLVRGALR